MSVDGGAGVTLWAANADIPSAQKTPKMLIIFVTRRVKNRLLHMIGPDRTTQI